MHAPKTLLTAISRDPGRENLHYIGVRSLGPDRLAVATDGHRLHALKTDLPEGEYRPDPKSGELSPESGVRFPDVAQVITWDASRAYPVDSKAWLRALRALSDKIGAEAGAIDAETAEERARRTTRATEARAVMVRAKSELRDAVAKNRRERDAQRAAIAAVPKGKIGAETRAELRARFKAERSDMAREDTFFRNAAARAKADYSAAKGLIPPLVDRADHHKIRLYFGPYSYARVSRCRPGKGPDSDLFYKFHGVELPFLPVADAHAVILGIDARYLTDALRFVGPSAEACWSDGFGPITFRSADGARMAVVMPMRL